MGFARNAEFLLRVANVSSEVDEPAPPDSGQELVLDEGSLMLALELGLKEMACGSLVALRISEKYANGSLSPKGNPVLNGAAIWAEIRLHRVENELGPGEHATVDCALAFAVQKKSQGNELFSHQGPVDTVRAVRRYEAGIRVLEALLEQPKPVRSSPSTKSAPPTHNGVMASDEERPAVCTALTALQLNCAQAKLRLQRWRSAGSLCDAVLKRDADNVKAHYRRGLARAELADLAGAADDLRRASVLSPTDAGARKELDRVDKLLKEHRAKEKRTFEGVFQKLQGEWDAEKEERTRREEERAKEEAEQRARQKEREKEMWKQCEIAKAERGARDAAEAAAEVDTLSGPDHPGIGKMGAEDERVMEKVADGQASALMLPQNLQSRTTEAPPPVEYEVPSFLRKKPKKPAS